MYSRFFLASNFPLNTFNYDPQTYKVLTGHGVLMNADESYTYIATTGLRTCVAFALISPQDQTVLLVHFYNLNQIKNNLKTMCDAFLEETKLEDQGAICVIAGGRDYCDGSIDMVDYISSYVKKHLSTKITPLKLRLDAPIVANYEETLSLKINVHSGVSELSLNTIDFCTSEHSSPTTTDNSDSASEESLAFEPITFTNWIAIKRAEQQIITLPGFSTRFSG